MEISGGEGEDAGSINQLSASGSENVPLRGPQQTCPLGKDGEPASGGSVLVPVTIPHPQPETCLLAAYDGEGCMPC